MAYGDYSKAQPLVKKALALARSKKIPEQELSLCLADMAYLYKNNNRLGEAENLCKDAIKLQEKTYGKDHPDIISMLRTLSSIYLQQHKYVQANAAINRAIAIMHENQLANNGQLAASLQVDVAKLLVAEGKLEQAQAYYSEVLQPIIDCYGMKHLYTANVLSDIADLYTQRGDYLEAEPLINQSLAIQQKVYGSDNRNIVSGLLTKAKIYRAKGDRVNSEILIRKTLRLTEKNTAITELVKLKGEIARIRTMTQMLCSPAEIEDLLRIAAPLL